MNAKQKFELGSIAGELMILEIHATDRAEQLEQLKQKQYDAARKARELRQRLRQIIDGKRGSGT